MSNPWIRAIIVAGIGSAVTWAIAKLSRGDRLLKALFWIEVGILSVVVVGAVWAVITREAQR